MEFILGIPESCLIPEIVYKSVGKAQKNKKGNVRKCSKQPLQEDTLGTGGTIVKIRGAKRKR